MCHLLGSCSHILGKIRGYSSIFAICLLQIHIFLTQELMKSMLITKTYEKQIYVRFCYSVYGLEMSKFSRIIHENN